MGALYVYEPWPRAVDTNGLCGPLTPTKATCTQEKNGDFRLDVEHPIDEWGKWAHLVEGNLIKADVPLRTPPEINYTTGAIITSIYAATVQNVSGSARSVYYGASVSTMRLAIIPVGTSVYVVDTEDVWKMIRWPRGFGWILASSLSISGTATTIPATVYGIESKVPAAKSRPQLFRISNVSLRNDGVSAVARHVYYDNAGALVDYLDAGSMTCLTAVQNVCSSSTSVDVSKYTNITSAAETSGWLNKPICEAMMSPSDGVLTIWNAILMRDLWIIYVLSEFQPSSGVVIEYGKNMRGVTYETNVDDIVVRVCPVGQTSKGKPLYVEPGTYTVDYVDYDCGPYVDSPTMIDEYDIPHVRLIDYGSKIKAAGTTSAQLLAARVKLIREALKEFNEKHVDLPVVTLSVEFTLLGDTAEYAQYRDLQKLFLYDTVRVKHPRLGIDVTTQVNRTVWNCLTDRYDSIELGSVRKNYARSKLAGWMVPGLDSLKSYVDTIGNYI